MTRRWIFLVPIGLLALAIFVFIGGHVVRLLWNGVLPDLFGWPQITFWQALGLLALCRILFGGFSSRGGPRSRAAMRDHFIDHMADRVANRLERMTPEERERFRQRVRERTGFDPVSER